MVRRPAFDEIGGFDENIFLYYEDADLCLRLRDAGYEIWFEAAAKVVHEGGASARQLFGSNEEINLQYLAARGRFLRRRRGVAAWRRYQLALTAFLVGRWVQAALAGDGKRRHFQQAALRATWRK